MNRFSRYWLFGGVVFLAIVIGCYAVFLPRASDSVNLVPVSCEGASHIIDGTDCRGRQATNILSEVGLQAAFLYLFEQFQTEPVMARQCIWFFEDLANVSLDEESLIIGADTVPRLVYNCFFPLGKVIAERFADTNEALAWCERLAPERRSLTECAEGVYLVHVYESDESLHDSVQSFPEIWSICTDTDELNTRACSFQLAREMVEDKEVDRTMFWPRFRALSEDRSWLFMKSILAGLMRPYVPSEPAVVQTIVGECMTEVPQYAEHCIRAGTVSTWEGSLAGEEFLNEVKYCSALNQSYAAATCWEYAAREIKPIYSPRLLEQLCSSDMHPEQEHLCSLLVEYAL